MFKERNYEKTNCRINDGFIREYDDLAYHFGIKLSSYMCKTAATGHFTIKYRIHLNSSAGFYF